MNGAHVHLFTNPAGFVYEIGCFASAPGCSHVGSIEDAFSWFPGWSWQIATCAACGVHLGWRYCSSGSSGSSGAQFHGVIVAALREGE